MGGKHLQEAVPDGSAAVRYQPYPEYKDSGVTAFGNIPKHWKIIPIKFSLEMPITDGPHSTPEFISEGIPFISAESVKNDRLDFSKKRGYISEEDHSLFSKKYKPKYGDVYMVKSGATTGSVARVETHDEFNIWSPLAVLRPHKDKSTTGFIFFALKSKPFYYSVELSWSYGTQQNIGMGVISNIKMPFPPLPEQQTIATFLDYKTAKIDALIAKKKALLDKLAEKRTALISHAVTKGLDPKTPMRDSGIDWLGEIPAHWEVKRLKFVVSVFGGGTPNTGKPEYWNGDIPWVSPKDMKSDLIGSTEDYLTELGVQESATKIVSSNSVLIVVRSGILRHTIPVARNTTEVALNQDMKALITKALLLPGYLHCLISGLQKGLLPLWSKPGCTVESIEMGYMLNTEIPIPPVSEQDQIISHVEGLLGGVDIQTARVTEIIIRLQEYRSALITNAVTGKIDVRNFRLPEAEEVVNHG